MKPAAAARTKATRSQLRPSSLPLLAFALLLMLVAPAACAQSGTLDVKLTPTSITTSPGITGNTTVTVQNPGLTPLLVTLSAFNASGGLDVTFDDIELDILPNSNESTIARVSSAQPGSWSFAIRARERTGVGASANAYGDAMLAVTVRANATTNNTNPTNDTPIPPPPGEDPPKNDTLPAPSPAPPIVNASEIVLHAARGSSARLRLEIQNPAAIAQTIDLTMRLPLGWAGSLESARLTIPANATLAARGSVTPNGQARADDNGELEIRSVSGIQLVRLRLLVDEPATSGADHLPDQPPSEHVLLDPENGDDASAAAPTVRAIPTLRVDPREVGAAPGTSVVFTLYVANAGDATLSGRARVDAEPLDVALGEPEFTAYPHEEVGITFIVTIPHEIPLGSSYEGVASIAFDVDPTLFLVHVQTGDPVLLAQVVHQQGPPTWLVWTLAGIGAAAVAAGAASRRWPLLGLAPLYARLAPRRALEHPRRAAMVALLQEEPGLTLADVQRRLGLSNGVARHHLALLEAAGALRSVPDGALRRLWPIGAAKAEAVPALRERALAMLTARGAMRASDLAAELGVSRQLLHYHVRKLEAEGRIAAKRVQQEIVLEPL